MQGRPAINSLSAVTAKLRTAGMQIRLANRIGKRSLRMALMMLPPPPPDGIGLPRWICKSPHRRAVPSSTPSCT